MYFVDPWYLPKDVEELRLHKNLHMDIYSSFLKKENIAQIWKQVGKRGKKVVYPHVMTLLN